MAKSRRVLSPRIVLDPGHGGRDPGAVFDGNREKYIASIITRKIQFALEDHSAAIITRSTDKYITLQHRCRMANNYHGDVFLSVHLNAVPLVSRNKGHEAVGMEAWIYEGSDNSRTVAQEILESVRSGFKGYGMRGIRETKKLYVLKHTKMPAILLEVGFIDGLHDRILLTCPEVQDRLAQLVADGLLHGLTLLDT